MNKQLDIIHVTRQNFVNLVDSLSIDELNEIPAGFNNNIAWNFGHIIVSQQNLCYLRAGISPLIDPSFIKKYQKGTRPEAFISSDEIAVLKTYLFSLLEDLRNDVADNKFENYQAFTTHFGVQLNNIQDAISFVATHEALHLGYAMAISKNFSIENQLSNFQNIKFSN